MPEHKRKTVVLTPLKCGDCGCEQFTLRHIKEDPEGPRLTNGTRIEGLIEVTCASCHKTSTIGPSSATLHVEGYLCG